MSKKKKQEIPKYFVGMSKNPNEGLGYTLSQDAAKMYFYDGYKSFTPEAFKHNKDLALISFLRDKGFGHLAVTYRNCVGSYMIVLQGEEVFIEKILSFSGLVEQYPGCEIKLISLVGEMIVDISQNFKLPEMESIQVA